jgi:hypothetical protein
MPHEEREGGMMPRTSFNQSVHDNSTMTKIRKGKDKKLKAQLDAWLLDLRHNETSYNKWHYQLWVNNNPNQKSW